MAEPETMDDGAKACADGAGGREAASGAGGPEAASGAGSNASAFRAASSPAAPDASADAAGRTGAASQTFFAHTACPWFPCHETPHPERFNCLFCFCPLYPLGEACGGNFAYTPSGTKDCSRCLLPHEGARGSDFVLSRIGRASALAGRRA